MARRGTALVVGASGVIGAPLTEQLIEAGWRVVAASRRAPVLRSGVPAGGLKHLAVDLADVQATRSAFARLGEVTHVFHCANDPRPEVRLRMLSNVLAAIEPAARRLANIHLMQGTKYYGCHLGPITVPARETDPRVAGADFYYSEEDFVSVCQYGKRWSWTATRPHAVCGYTANNPMNLAVVLAIYGSLCKALGRAFAFPASEACFRARFNVMDADLLARAAIWCSTTPACANQAFNVNNGDVFGWHEIWPRLAAFFGLEPAAPGGESLAEFLAAQEPMWRALAERHGLKAFPYEQAAQWVQGDYRFPNSRLACEYDVHADLGRLRAHGFRESVDSAAMFVALFARLRGERVIP
jgi:nucleoside-diphosphate-sugar epimerase